MHAALAQEDFSALDYSRAQNLASFLLQDSTQTTYMPGTMPTVRKNTVTVIIIAVLVAVILVVALIFLVGLFVGLVLHRRVK